MTGSIIFFVNQLLYYRVHCAKMNRSPKKKSKERKKTDFVEINMINVEKTVLPSVFCIAVPGIITETDDKFDCVDEPRVLEETKHCGPVCLFIHPIISVKHLKKTL